jgi:hypothetical protein
VVLNSLHAQQVVDRRYEICANALFSLSVVLRFIGSEAQAQEVDTLVDALIDQTLEDLRQESLRIREVVESNGIETAIGYTSAKMRCLLGSPWHRNKVAAVSTTTLRTSLGSSSDDWRLVPRSRSHRSTHRQVSLLQNSRGASCCAAAFALRERFFLRTKPVRLSC